MTPEEKRNRWKWARKSEEVKNVRKMEADFIATVKQSNRLALLQKEKLKKKKNQKKMNILEKCKSHGGPVTPSEMDLLDKLSEEELILEISYLRLTIAPNIRQRRRTAQANGKYKMEHLCGEARNRSGRRH